MPLGRRCDRRRRARCRRGGAEALPRKTLSTGVSARPKPGVGRKIDLLLQLGGAAVDGAAGQVRVVGVQIRGPLDGLPDDLGAEAGCVFLEYSVDGCRQAIGGLVVVEFRGADACRPRRFRCRKASGSGRPWSSGRRG